MTEQKEKRRGWVKNAAIIFLAVMLVLTFFSNTIMNRALPEVAAQYVESGSINAKIRGSGTVTANESYEVIVNQSREVRTVCVSLGDVVNVGDPLFILADTDSTELTEAMATLDSLKLSYQKALLQSSDSDYSRENREIQLAREALNEAIAKRDSSVVDPSALSSAKLELSDAEQYLKELNRSITDIEQEITELTNEQSQWTSTISEYQSELAELKAELSDYEKQLSDIDVNSDALKQELTKQVNSVKAEISDKQAELKQAQNELAEDRLAYRDAFAALEAAAVEKLLADGKDPSNESDLDLYMAAEAKIAASDPARSDEAKAYELIVGGLENIDKLEADIEELESDLDDLLDSLAELEGGSSSSGQAELLEKEIAKVERKISSLSDDIDVAEDRSNRIGSDIDDAQTQKIHVGNQVQDQQELISDLTDRIADLENTQATYESAVENVKACEKTLEDLLFALEEQQKADGVTSALEQLDLAAMRKDISKQEELVAKYQEDATGSEILSNVSGTVTSINVTSGNTTSYGQALATIDVTDRGYSLTLSVTNEQSQKVRIGDQAEVTNYYWGNEIVATLENIKNDPENPRTNKQLVFRITGDVESGTNLSLSIGQKSANYDTIVPNSAIRSDANGNFVLIIVAKSTPLGSRYTATRVDVNVLASDDTYTAVSGGLTSYDYVITTSTRPIEAGMLVRMADNT